MMAPRRAAAPGLDSEGVRQGSGSTAGRNTDSSATTYAVEVAPRVCAAMYLLECVENGLVDRDTAITGSIGLLRAARCWCEILDFERRLAS